MRATVVCLSTDLYLVLMNINAWHPIAPAECIARRTPQSASTLYKCLAGRNMAQNWEMVAKNGCTVLRMEGAKKTEALEPSMMVR